MDKVNFRQRLLKTLIYCFFAYIALGYIVFASVVLHYEISLLPDDKLIYTAADIQKRSGTLSTRVHNIFGDPIPYAVIFIDGRITQADSTGFFIVEELKPQRYTLEIFSGDYQPYQWDILIDDGTNNPPIKYDTGLWPQYFLPDFHVFHNNTNQLFGLIGFANGSKQPIYIHRAAIYDPNGNIILDLFEDPDIVEYYQMLSTKVESVTTPQQALRLPSKTWINGEIPPIDSPLTPGVYQLEVHYGTETGHQSGVYRVQRIEDYLQTYPNWNPHLP